MSLCASMAAAPKPLENYDYIISRHLSPFEKISRVRVFLESFGEARSAKFSFGLRRKSWTPEQKKKEAQLQKERFAIYLSGSRKGIPPCLSVRENLYAMTIWLTTKACLLRTFAPNLKSWHDFLGCFTYQNIHHVASFA
ncbi:9af7c5c4-acde-4149-9727-0cd418cab84c [Sclerotinia trifoliorum]|uniref:9af7c5c4-acde-4149-9727-0cd418cab84c n=1 Tax=Sclerotinia trifoliorum TaxID=28548 RepID=A0A8H2W2U3_9HELO|nr:9af7c5c4-acde-4149-9727-0cd418cab84c [Sclerotinia trifoliorum]